MGKNPRRLSIDIPVGPSPSVPTATGIGVDTAYPFSRQTHLVVVQNNTAAALYVDFDTVATQGSFLVAPGQMAVFEIPCTVLHLYTAAAQNINGTAASGIVVRGWA